MFHRKALRRSLQPVAQLAQGFRVPLLRPAQQDTDAVNVVFVALNIYCEGDQIILRLILLAVSTSDQPGGGDLVLRLVADQEHALLPLVPDELVLETRTSQQSHA